MKKRDIFSEFEPNLVDGFERMKIKKVRFEVLVFLLLLFFLFLLFRVFHLQIAQSAYFQELASGNRLRRVYIVPPRGLILDRNDKKLAFNEAAFSLVISPLDFSQNPEERRNVYNQIKEELNLDIAQEVEKALDKNIKEEIVFLLDIERTKALILQEKWSLLKGVKIEERFKRKYTAGLSHILGYLGKITDEEWSVYKDKEYLFYEWVGKAGLEKEYQDELRGYPGGKEVEVDALGKIQKILAQKEAQPGANLKLYLDLDLQLKAREILERKLKDLNLKKGVVVALDPKTGGVLAMVSLPDYDNNLFLDHTNSLLQQVLTSLDHPLFNRVISGLYPSGSTIKPVVAAAALQEGIVGALSSFLCQGELTVPNQYDPSIVYHYKDWKTHGIVDVRKAIAVSCNVFFYIVGGGYQDFRGLGAERLTKYFRFFGLGQKSGIDLPQELGGLIPTPDWKEKTKKEPWYLGDTYHLSIGQGDLLVTPLQVARYTMVIANGGWLYQPHLVKEILDAQGKKIKTITPEGEKLPVAESNLEIVREGMRQAVISGSANQLQSLSITSAGKTGTAEDPTGSGEPHSWFTCFAPYEDPRIVVTVMVEHGGEGYKVAEPIAKEILEFWQNKIEEK
ncbi:penicillin-binding protein 2 [bacterium]|nr:penicillin-binding protein 2 [bacterium]